MLEQVRSALASLASIPALVVLNLIHRGVTGDQVVLEVHIERAAGPLERQLLLDLLRQVPREPAVSAVLLHLRQVPGGWAACQDLARVIAVLRSADVPVYALVETPGNSLMWLAAQCSHVWMVPTGQVALLGVGAELTFFGSALAQLGIETDFVAAGEYKSFGEAYSRTYASSANQEAISELVEDLQQQLVEGIASGRGLEMPGVRAVMASGLLSAEQAEEAGLVDALAYEDQVRTAIEGLLGEDTSFIDFSSWSRRVRARRWLEANGSTEPQIAVLHLEGPIAMDGPQTGTGIRARTAVEALKQLQEDDDVRGVVLHINSPGGNAVASDLIWRAVQRLRLEKPVVASYADVSASGGVYLAAAANQVLCRAGTLTGSIGVFGGKLVLGGAMRRLGVHTQVVAPLPNATLFSASRPFSRPQRERFRQSLERFYEHFVQRVASGRGRLPAEIEPHCRGRVWTGAAALERGLVDRLGDLSDAVSTAAELAELTDGHWRRTDFSTQEPRNPILRFLARQLQRAVPALGQLGVRRGVLPGVEMLPVNLRFVVEHPMEPLALLPFDWDHCPSQSP